MDKFIHFSNDVSTILLPNEIDYPHNYIPHEIAKIATKELQEYLTNPTHFEYDLQENAVGKMFGVLVVKNTNNELGYLAAFSGKLEETMQHQHFVPPVFDALDETSFYKNSERELEVLSNEINELESNEAYLNAANNYVTKKEFYQLLLEEEKLKIKARRKLRKSQNKIDNQQNINEEFYLKEYQIYISEVLKPLEEKFRTYQVEIDDLIAQRKEKSNWTQSELFKNYQFLNTKGETKDLITLFSNQNISAGTGDCCAPKLFQYAFKHNLTPIALAEFWWGKPLNSSVRKHQSFYAACTGKCKPILEHMLDGLQVAENPLKKTLETPKTLEIIYEDNYIVIVNKPEGMLSVPGKDFTTSVKTLIKEQFPKASGPLLVHRLDMATSGILIISKDSNTHKKLQQQFINRTVQKRYVALLNGNLKQNKGTIDLPLRVDLDDRPKQLVCFEHGKKAVTNWEVVEVKNNQARVHLYPITGRTHQLRVHMAHQLGLNTPILGDVLYGTKADRLHLHAEYIRFVHPNTNKEIEFFSNPNF